LSCHWARLDFDSQVGDGCRLLGSLPVEALAHDLVDGTGQPNGLRSRSELNALAIN